MKKLINNLLRPTGYAFARIDRYPEIKYKWLKDFNVNTIIDAGANEGQFALSIKKTLTQATVYSFEPLKQTYEILKTNIAHYPEMKAFNIALGDFNGKSRIFKNDYSPSSSILELGEKHLEAYPESDKVTFEEIAVQTLDDFISKNPIVMQQNILFKLDVQGFEDKVLLGAKETLKKVKIVFVEMSFWELYKKQALFDDIYSLMKDCGFRYRGNFDVAFNKENGLPIFSDGIFIKEDGGN